MIYAVISDIHANLEALRRVLKDAANNGAEKIICLGDIVGYGPRPTEALALIRAQAAVILAGNHDDAVSGRLDARDFIELAGEAVKRHRQALKKSDRAYLATLPYSTRIDGAIFTHGDFTDPTAFNYIDDESAARANFDATDAHILFVGHTHVPELYISDAEGGIHHLDPHDFITDSHQRYLVNVGSVGYPRESNGTCYSSYVLYDSTTGAIRFRRLPFSVASVMTGAGEGAYRKLPRLLVSLALGGLFCIAIFIATRKTAVITSKAPDASVVAAAEAEEKDPTIITNCLVFLNSKQHAVAANLRLQRGSPAAHLTIEFENAQGEALAPLTIVIQNSSKKAFPAPPGTTQAKFTLRAYQEDRVPQITKFAPCAR